MLRLDKTKKEISALESQHKGVQFQQEELIKKIAVVDTLASPCHHPLTLALEQPPALSLGSSTGAAKESLQRRPSCAAPPAQRARLASESPTPALVQITAHPLPSEDQPPVEKARRHPLSRSSGVR